MKREKDERNEERKGKKRGGWGKEKTFLLYLIFFK